MSKELFLAQALPGRLRSKPIPDAKEDLWHMNRWIMFVGLALQPLLVWSAPQVVASGDSKIYLDDTPGWVKSVGLSASPTNDSNTDPLTIELVDTQVSVRPGQVSRFTRLITRVNNQAGVESISRFPIPYISNYQTLTIHGLWVTHDEKRASRLDPLAIRLISNESAMDQGIYLGIVIAVVFVKDLKVGDQLEISYSISGNNPVLGEHTLGSFTLAASAPAAVVHARLLAPTDRHFEFKTFNTATRPAVRIEDGYTDTTVLLKNVPKHESEPQMPPESSDMPSAQFSDFRSWEEVGDWARSLFAWKGSLPPELQTRTKEWLAQSQRPEDAARQALDYVQKEIRYVSLSIGENALRPAAPDEVIRRGFGDCKDKTLLLVTLLRSMDIAASPALVSTSSQGATFARLPSAESFDHAIVATEMGGVKYWLDGTNAFQAGPLSARSVGNYGKALVIRPDASTVESVAPPPGHKTTVSTSHRFVITKFSEPVDLFIHATYAGMPAEVNRARVQADQSAIDKEHLDLFRRLYPSAERVGAETWHTDATSGHLNVAVHYRIPGFFEYGNGLARSTVTATAIWLEVGGTQARKSALSLSYPLVMTQDIAVEFPEAVPFAYAKPVSIKDDYATFTFSKKYEESKLALHFEYQTLASSVPATAVEHHIVLRKRISKWLWIGISLPVTAAQGYNHRGSIWSSKGDYDRAIADFDEAIRLNPQDADSYINRGNAWSSKADYDRAIANYSEAIRVNPQYAQAYSSRGDAWNSKGDYDRAILDHSEAIRLTQNAWAYDSRGFAWSGKGDFERAIVDYDEAIRLDPHFAMAYRNRGVTQFDRGEVESAEVDLSASLRLDPSDVYSVIWRYVAQSRAGHGAAAASELEQNAAKVDREKWPAPIIELFAGTVDIDSLLKVAARGDAKTQHDQLCEAAFYVGELHLLQRRQREARAFFEQAERDCPKDFLEYFSAIAELKKSAQ